MPSGDRAQEEQIAWYVGVRCFFSSFRNNLFLPTLTSKVVGGIKGSDLRTQYTASLFLLNPPSHLNV